MKKLLPTFMLGATISASCMYAQPVFAADGGDAAGNYADLTAVTLIYNPT